MTRPHRGVHRAGLTAVLLLLGAGVAVLSPARAQDVEPGSPPQGITPLPVDLFTTENFYFDRQYWTDRRYTRCNTPRQLTDMWTRERVGEWGDCDVDRDVAEIVSPYAYPTAAAHYAALLAEAESRGGPTSHTRASLPDWDGIYVRGGAADQWIYGRNLQAATMISLLTPEYQTRMTQMNYHEAVSNSPQWNAAFCYPEGLMRWWSQAAIRSIEVLATPHQVQFLAGVADNFLRKVLIGREHVQQVPQWYGETVGFWDGDALVAWTANVQGWTISHSMFEYSNALEVVEVFRPNEAGDGLVVDATFYDPDAFTRPLHTVTPWMRRAGPDDAENRYTFIECRVQSTILNGPDGRPKTETLTGRLTRFIPGANHAQLIFELLSPDGESVRDAAGKPVQWGVEGAGAQVMARQGVSVKAFPLGTVFTVALNPLRDGRPFGAMAGLLIKCGMTVPEGGCTEETGDVLIQD